MKIRYQADNDLDQRVIDAVMRLAAECDFKTAPEAGFHTGTPDPEVLRIAAEDERVLVGHAFDLAFRVAILPVIFNLHTAPPQV